MTKHDTDEPSRFVTIKARRRARDTLRRLQEALATAGTGVLPPEVRAALDGAEPPIAPSSPGGTIEIALAALAWLLERGQRRSARARRGGGAK